MQRRTFKQLFAKCDHLGPDCPHKWVADEERANMVTHGIGIGLSIAALILLTIHASLHGGAKTAISCAIYGITLFLTYTSSTLYHSTRQLKIKAYLRTFDHICIYLLIAGTYTPFALVPLAGAFGWTLFAIIWSLAFAGAVFKFYCTGKYEWLSTLIYIMMGWIVVLIALGPILQSVPLACILWLLVGGLLYTGGVFFFLMETVPFSHTVWHFFVLGGSFCHFIAIYCYIAPMR